MTNDAMKRAATKTVAPTERTAREATRRQWLQASGAFGAALMLSVLDDALAAVLRDSRGTQNYYGNTERAGRRRARSGTCRT